MHLETLNILILIVFFLFCDRFQAIECFLANVKSTNEEEVDMWQPEAISRFEEVTHGKIFIFKGLRMFAILFI